MAYRYSKGWYVSELKKLGIRKWEDRKLESFRSYVLASVYERAIQSKK